MTRKAIVNIFSSYNNALLTATDLTGAETIAKCSGGQVVKSSKDSGGPFAATRAAEMLADMLKEKEFTQLIIVIGLQVEINLRVQTPAQPLLEF